MRAVHAVPAKSTSIVTDGWNNLEGARVTGRMVQDGTLPLIEVAAGVLQDSSGRVLISQRLPGAHEAGAWEFPGGKIHASEEPVQGLMRELACGWRESRIL